MAGNYSSWTVGKLVKEKEKIEKAISLKEGRERKAALTEIRAVAKKNGFDLAELLGESGAAPAKRGRGRPAGSSTAKPKKATSKRAPAKVKFRNPENKAEKWTGRGRKPRWVVAHLEGGGSMDQLAI